MDGAVGCVSLCPRERSLPKLGCAKPRLVKVPGRCCEELVCPEEGQTGNYPAKKHSKEHSRNSQTEDDLTHRNELVPVSRGGLKSLPGESSSVFILFSTAEVNLCYLHLAQKKRRRKKRT